MTIVLAPPVGTLSPQQQGLAAGSDGNPVNVFVSAAADLAAKPGWQSDSWFVTSHLETSRGLIDMLIHVNRISPPDGGPGELQVMASLLDSSTGGYISDEQDFPLDQCSLSAETCDIVYPIGSISGDPQALRVRGTWATIDLTCDITLSQAGPMLANGGTGLWPMLSGLTYHYALPTMTTTGTVTLDGTSLDVRGNSWLDRQWSMTDAFFSAQPPRWLWLGVCLDDGTRISAWDLFESDRRHSFATIVNPRGAHEVVSLEPTEERASRPWTSPVTGRNYPTRWDVRMPQIDGQLIVQSNAPAQEFAASHNPMSNHYEGASTVTGTLHGRPVQGYATLELVGPWQ